MVQAADFSPAPLAARRLVRREQRRLDVKRLEQQMLGILEKREAIVRPDPSGRDVSLALRDVALPLARASEAKGEPFDEAVRRKRREASLPVALPAKILPPAPNRRDGAGPGEDVAAPRALGWLERAVDAMVDRKGL